MVIYNKHIYNIYIKYIQRRKDYGCFKLQSRESPILV